MPRFILNTYHTGRNLLNEGEVSLNNGVATKISPDGANSKVDVAMKTNTSQLSLSPDRKSTRLNSSH